MVPYVFYISDVELTDKPGIAIKADRGFTTRDMLEELKTDLPPFLNNRHQPSATEVDNGQKIAALRIHVERAIGRIKTFNILRYQFANICHSNADMTWWHNKTKSS